MRKQRLWSRRIRRYDYARFCWLIVRLSQTPPTFSTIFSNSKAPLKTGMRHLLVSRIPTWRIMSKAVVASVNSGCTVLRAIGRTASDRWVLRRMAPSPWIMLLHAFAFSLPPSPCILLYPPNICVRATSPKALRTLRSSLVCTACPRYCTTWPQ